MWNQLVTVLAPLCRASNEENLTSILFSILAVKLLQLKSLTANLFLQEITHWWNFWVHKEKETVMIIDGFMLINEVFKWPCWWTNVTIVKFQMIKRLENCLMTAVDCNMIVWWFIWRYANKQSLKVAKVKALSTKTLFWGLLSRVGLLYEITSQYCFRPKKIKTLSTKRYSPKIELQLYVL